jgi:S-sulfo-L-cysteine synthase (3-phospho-L-serine-dependent)
LKHILFIETNSSGHGMEMLGIAKKMGYRVTFASFNPAYYLKRSSSFQESGLSNVDHFIRADTHENLECLYARVKEIHAHLPFSGVIASGDLEVETAAKVASYLGLPSARPEAVMTAKNKFYCRQRLVEAGLPQPAFRLASNSEEAVLAAHQIGFPCIVKPVDDSGSMGVKLAYSEADVSDAIQQHLAEEYYSRGYKKFPAILVEEYVPGPVCSVEIVCTRHEKTVLGISDREMSSPPHFVERSVGFPATPECSEDLVSQALRALVAVGYDFGPAHVEFMIGKNGPMVLEINPRLIGGHVSKIIERVRQRPILEELIKLYCGDENLNFGENRGAGVQLYFEVDREGRLSSLHIPTNEFAQHSENIIDIKVMKKNGAVVRPPQSNDDCLGQVITYADSISNARAIAHTLRSKIEQNIVLSGELEAGK